MKIKKSTIIIVLIFSIYTFITVIPFYFVFIRAFVPTSKATKLHIWLPKLEELNMDMTYGAMTTYYNLDPKKFKEDMGINNYIGPHIQFSELIKRFNIPKEKITNYLTPYLKFNGWFVMLTDFRFLHSLIMTVVLTTSSIMVGGFLGISTGSVLARFKKKWHQSVYNIYMMQVIIPPIMIILPLYIILGKTMGLNDSYLSLFLLYIQGGAISTMIFTTYISTLPRELKDSVDVDGGGRLTYFFKIIVPLSKVPFATYIAIHLPKFWNDLLFGRVFLSDVKYTLVPLIDSFRGFYTSNFQAIYAGLAITMIPIFVVYLLFQNLFVRSALAGALKG